MQPQPISTSRIQPLTRGLLTAIPISATLWYIIIRYTTGAWTLGVTLRAAAWALLLLLTVDAIRQAAATFNATR